MAKKPKTFISDITFSGGSRFSFGKEEKIIIVGPNNSGKSQTLRELKEFSMKGKGFSSKVISDTVFQKEGSLAQLKKFLESNASKKDKYYYYNDWKIHESYLNKWNTDPYLYGELANGFIKSVGADLRLSICEKQYSISPGEQKTKPQHILYDDSDAMEKVSNLFYESFGSYLMFDFRGGKTMPIHVGAYPDIKHGCDRVGEEYVAAVRSNPLLDKQGDGMKSYAGILFETIVSNLDITLLDEPEAFLHPPQMRRLGETLSSEVSGQLFVATHSSDVLRGFLEGTKGKVRILRIRRDGDKNYVTEAPSAAISELWNKPELRYSNALDGVFHEQTIICEDDSDCRIFNSVADYLASLDANPWKDTSYVPTGGKSGVPKIASVLRAIGVPVKAVFDIDFLSDQHLVKKTVEAFGGDWQKINVYWKRVDSAVRKGSKPKSVTEIKDDIIEIVKDASSESLPKSEITEAMKQGAPWNVVKKYGVSGIPSGEVQTDYQHLKEKLQKIGIFVVPVGEIENFCKELGSHGPKFVSRLLENISMNDVRLTELREFVREVHQADVVVENQLQPVSTMADLLSQ